MRSPRTGVSQGRNIFRCSVLVLTLTIILSGSHNRFRIFSHFLSAPLQSSPYHESMKFTRIILLQTHKTRAYLVGEWASRNVQHSEISTCGNGKVLIFQLMGAFSQYFVTLTCPPDNTYSVIMCPPCWVDIYNACASSISSPDVALDLFQHLVTQHDRDFTMFKYRDICLI